MLFRNAAKSPINRVLFAVLLAIMWVAPVVFGWISYETHGHHLKMAFGFCAAGCLLEVYAITFLFGGLKFIRNGE